MAPHTGKTLGSAASQGQFDSASVWNAMYLGEARGNALRSIYRQAYGNDYPEDADPHSFITKTELARIADLLSIGTECTLVDLGCGRGGPGLWVARETGSSLIGIDLSDVAIGHARAKIANFGLEGRARFQVADLCHTGLEESTCHGAMSIDTLWTVDDKRAALDETCRILHSGSSFVFTTWEYIRPAGAEYCALLEECGFQVEEHSEKPDWLRRERAWQAGIIANKEKLFAEMGEASALPLIQSAEKLSGLFGTIRHVLISCRKG